MPVFECSRCNNLTYSASRFALLVCDVCGSNRQRILEHAFSFAEARDEPRELGPGDHCCLTLRLRRAGACPLCMRLHPAGHRGRRARPLPRPRRARAADPRRAAARRGRAGRWGPAEDIYGPGLRSRRGRRALRRGGGERAARGLRRSAARRGRSRRIVSAGGLRALRAHGDRGRDGDRHGRRSACSTARATRPSTSAPATDPPARPVGRRGRRNERFVYT